MGSDDSHFNVSVGSDEQSQDSVHKPQPFYTGHFDRNPFTRSCKRVGGGLRKGGALMNGAFIGRFQSDPEASIAAVTKGRLMKEATFRAAQELCESGGGRK